MTPCKGLAQAAASAADRATSHRLLARCIRLAIAGFTDLSRFRLKPAPLEQFLASPAIRRPSGGRGIARPRGTQYRKFGNHLF